VAADALAFYDVFDAARYDEPSALYYSDRSAEIREFGEYML
jgi:hypothetical protein